MLTDQDLEELCRSGESGRIEFKKNDNNPDSIHEAVCALANDLPDLRQPGVVVVGMEDDGTCADLDIDDHLLGRLAKMRDSGILTPFPAMEVRTARVGGCKVAAIIVQPSENPPIRTRGRAWIRVGSRRAVATPDEERRLVEKRRWSNPPFDARPVTGATLQDIDLQRFRTEYLPTLVSTDCIEADDRSVGQQLQALRLLSPDGVPTAAAILMLAKSPQNWFPGATIEWRRVAGLRVSDDTTDDRSLTGTITDQLRRIDDVLGSTIATEVEMRDSRHRKTADYPRAALQQLVRNAVMHRTYEGTMAPVRVTWFTDRVEILSPGGPFGTVTRKNFGRSGYTDYRNPTLSEVLKGYGFVERFGQGLEMTRQTLKENGNPEMEFRLEPDEAPNWVHVTVRKKT